MIRSFAFNALFYPALILFSLFLLVIFPFASTPYIQKVASKWILFILNLLRVICGVDWRVEGRSNLPNGPCVIASNHQGPWESLFIQTLLIPSSSVVKRELLLIPFFGWAVATTKPIIINRSEKFKSLKKVIKAANKRISQGFSIILFPEGTRVSPSEGVQKFGSSCGVISCKNKIPLVPVCHNSGKYWRNGKFKKYPGTIVVRIGAPISEADPKKATNLAYNWVSNNYRELY